MSKVVGMLSMQFYASVLRVDSTEISGAGVNMMLVLVKTYDIWTKKEAGIYTTGENRKKCLF